MTTSVQKGNPAWKKGVVQNPKGRGKGNLNKASLVQQEIAAALMQDLDGHARMILGRAIEMAKNGDRQMIKLLLGKILADASVNSDNTEKGNVGINITISGFSDKGEILDAEVVEDSTE